MELAYLKNLFISNFKLKPKAFLIFFLIILSLHLTELFILPINCFTFRAWEAVRTTKKYRNILGPFYPNINLQMEEEGDLATHTPLAVKKNVIWQTDKFGYRNENRDIDYYDMVVLGNSNFAGSTLTQEETLANVLENKLNKSVYNFSPNNIANFLKDERFTANPPTIFIHGFIEREIIDLAPLSFADNQESLKQKILNNFLRKHIGLTVILDKLNKRIVLFYLKDAITRQIENILFSVNPRMQDKIFYSNGSSTMIFSKDNAFTIEPTDKKIDQIVRIIKSYQETLTKRGIRYIFLPVPEKETTYFRYIPEMNQRSFLDRLIVKLKKADVEVIDITKLFDEKAVNGELLFNLDDTHWNAQGVALSADFVSDFIQATIKE